MNQGYVYRHEVQARDAGRAVLDHHAARFLHATREEWRARIETGAVLVDGIRIDPDHVLRAGAVITYHRAPWVEPEVSLAFRVVYEDRHVLVVDKPSGLQVQPGGIFQEHTLLHQVRISAPHRLESAHIHRLGRGTSGLVLFGLTHLARAGLSEQFRRCEPCKTYFALAHGTHLPDSIQARHPIGPVPHGPMTIWCAAPTGKASHTRLRVLVRDHAADTSLVAAQPVTGRPDQIRIHLAACGAPLVGDELFGPGGTVVGDVPPGKGGYRLHATALRFRHPVTGETVKVRSRPPWLP